MEDKFIHFLLVVAMTIVIIVIANMLVAAIAFLFSGDTKTFSIIFSVAMMLILLIIATRKTILDFLKKAAN